MEPRPLASEVTCGNPPTLQSSQQLTEHVTVRIKQELAEDHYDQKPAFLSKTGEDDCKRFDVSLTKAECNDAQECSASQTYALLNKHEEGVFTEPAVSVITKVKEEEECKVEVEDHVPYKFDPGLHKQVVYNESIEFFKHGKHSASHVEDTDKPQAGAFVDTCKLKREHDTDLGGQVGSEHASQVEVFVCSRCNSTATDKDCLTKHMKRHRNGTAQKYSKTKQKKDPSISVYQCANCSYTNKSKRNLYRHIQRIHDRHADVYQCSRCDYVTKHKCDLRRHSKYRHDPGVALFKCKFCDFAAKTPHNLSKHVDRRHNSDGPEHQCTQCSYVSKVKYNLSRHVKAFHEQHAAAYKCPHCDYVAKRNCDLTQHSKVRHGPDVRLYKCSECDYTCKCRSYLTKHFARKHNLDAPVYRCANCSYTTRLKYNLSTHFKSIHNSHV